MPADVCAVFIKGQEFAVARGMERDAFVCSSSVLRLQFVRIARESGRIASLGTVQFFDSPEYRTRNTTNNQFVTDLYNTYFGRAPDSGGLAYWSQQLASGKPRGAVLNDFLFSEEIKLFLAQLKYLATPPAETFMPAAAPGIIATTMLNAHYDTHEAYVFALARQMSGSGQVITFEVDGGKAEAFRFVNALQIVLISNNLGDAKSIITHPATTTHQRLKPEARAELGISDGMLRLSAGLEAFEDLARDLDRGLAAI
jgi:hypothetical protein